MRRRRAFQFARRIFRDETFRLMIEPAIADMQAEASRGTLFRWKHYVGIGVLLISALLEDLRLDVSFAFDPESRRIAWKRAVLWYAGGVGVFTALGMRYDIPWKRIDWSAWPAALISTALEGLVMGALPGTLCAIVYLYRRRLSRRSIVAVAILVGTLTTGLALAVRPLRMSADQVLFNEVQSSDDDQFLSSAHQQRAYAAPHFDIDENVAWWKEVLIGVQLLAWVPIGVILGRRRGWRIALTFLGILITWVLSVGTLTVVADISSHSARSFLMQRWTEIGLNVFVGSLWLICDSVMGRTRERAA
jgi:hypothetical protein